MQAQKCIDVRCDVSHTEVMANPSDETPVSVRLSAKQKAAIQKVAAKERRSMNQTIIFLLDRALAAYARDGMLFEPESSSSGRRSIQVEHEGHLKNTSERKTG
jgi:hypothetical protein